MEVAVGDRVKLTAKVVTAMTIKGRKQSLNWKARRGTVVRITAFTDSITVLWDGRTSEDQWPTKAITVVKQEKEGSTP